MREIADCVTIMGDRIVVCTRPLPDYVASAIADADGSIGDDVGIFLDAVSAVTFMHAGRSSLVFDSRFMTAIGVSAIAILKWRARCRTVVIDVGRSANGDNRLARRRCARRRSRNAAANQGASRRASAEFSRLAKHVESSFRYAAIMQFVTYRAR